MGRVRIPTKPPLLFSDIFPFHIPEALSKVEKETPPITTSSKGAHSKDAIEDEEVEDEGSHRICPGSILILGDDFGKGCGMEINFELCFRNRRASHGSLLEGASLGSSGACASSGTRGREVQPPFWARP